MRGPSGLGASRAEEKGASRLARAGVLERYVEHGKQAQRSPGARIACFDRRVVRNAGYSNRKPRPTVFTNHESRDTNHGLFGAEALQSFFPHRAGMASGEQSRFSCQVMPGPWRQRKQGPPARRRLPVEPPQSRPMGFFTKHETRNTNHGFFSRHETRITAFFRNTRHGFFANHGFSRGSYGARWY